MTETLASGYSNESARRELSNEYHHDRAGMVFKSFSVLALGTKVASALEGLSLPLEIVIRTYDTVDNYFEMRNDFTKY